MAVRYDKIKPLICFSVDTRGWAFHNIALQVAKHLSQYFEFVITAPGEPAPRCDALVCLWWRLWDDLDRSNAHRSVACFYDHWSYSRYAADAGRVLSEADAVIVANDLLLRELLLRWRLPAAWVCEDGVDLELFPWQPLPQKLIFGWTGRSDIALTRDGRPDGKGLGLLMDAAEMARVPLVVQDSRNMTVRHDKMAEAFYHNIAVYCCASDCEGTPNTILEAAACGRPVITTDVGLARKLVHHGYSGLLVERSVSDFADAFRRIKQMPLEAMSRNARRAARLHAWSAKIGAWWDCLSSLTQ